MKPYPVRPERKALLSIAEKAEKRLLDDELTIEDIGILLFQDKQERHSFYEDIIETCKAGNPSLFDGVTSFDNAWKNSRDLFRMANHASYSRRRKC
ncbi:MAG: hypothetical protein PHY54_11080 [Methylococcales bacterium]|nr:hypothetical protein [Methylococcales bacterium]